MSDEVLIDYIFPYGLNDLVFTFLIAFLFSYAFKVVWGIIKNGFCSFKAK